MKVTDGIAFCQSSSYYINSYYTFLTDYDSDIYTATLKNSDVPTVVGTARPVEITNEDMAVSMLKVDSSVGVLPFDIDSDSIQSQSDIEKYMEDSINLACVGTKTNDDEASSNVAVFGSYYMFTSSFLSTTSFNNANYIVNFCNTVTDRGDMGITITTAEANIPELGTITDSTVSAMYFIFIGAVPVIILLIGLLVFIRRRNR
jgi:ABC-2 type transport system permease protein